MPDWMKEWWPVLALAVGIGSPLMTAWIGWSIRQRFALKEDLAAETRSRSEAIDAERKARHDREAELREAVSVERGRVDRLEADMEHMPTAKAVNDLMLQMTRIEGKMSSFEERLGGFAELMKRMDRQVQVMDDFLRKVTV